MLPNTYCLNCIGILEMTVRLGLSQHPLNSASVIEIKISRANDLNFGLTIFFLQKEFKLSSQTKCVEPFFFVTVGT